MQTTMIQTNPYNKVILIDPTTIKDTTIIGSEVDDAMIRATAVKVQKIELQKAIGSSLLRKLQQLVKENEISLEQNAKYKVLLDEYITPYLSAMVVSDIAFDLTFKFRNKGVIDSIDTNINSVSFGDIARLTEKHKIIAATYRDYLCKFLCSNSAEYPELHDCANEIVGADLHKEFPCPIVLD